MCNAIWITRYDNEICIMFVCKHTKQNMIKISLNFEKNVTSRVNNLRMLRIKNDKFQSNVFIPTQKYSEIFKSA